MLEGAAVLPFAGGVFGVGTNPMNATVAAGGRPVIFISDSRSSRSLICLLLGIWDCSFLRYPFYRLDLAACDERAEPVGGWVVPAIVSPAPDLLQVYVAGLR